MIRLILDVATMRVIYFTEDPDESLAVVDKTLSYDYLGEMPSGMKLGNSWNYRLVGNKLINTETSVAAKPSLLESNRREAQKLLIDRINQTRSVLFSGCFGGDWVRGLKLQDEAFLESLAQAEGVSPDQYRLTLHETKNLRDRQIKNTEINRAYYTRLLNEADTNEKIIELRDEFANNNLLELQMK
jgi:hypothetical protein